MRGAADESTLRNASAAPQPGDIRHRQRAARSRRKKSPSAVVKGADCSSIVLGKMPVGITFGQSDRIAWFILTAALISLSIASRLGMIAWPFINDAGLYAYLGKTVAEGGVMYRDFYETKLPGVGLIASAFWRAFGSSWAGYVLSQLALAILAAAMLGRIARRHIRNNAALPTFLFAAVFLNFAFAVYTGFQLETIQAFFETTAALAAVEVIRARSTARYVMVDAFTAGLAAAMAAMLKPGGVGVGLALALVLLGQRRTTRPLRQTLALLSALLIGLIIPTAVTILYAIRSGAWPFLPGVMKQIERYANATPIDFTSLLKLTVVIAILSFPPIIRGLFARISQRDQSVNPRRDVPANEKGSPALLAFTLLWFCFDLLSVILQRRMYPYHFLPLACPAALLYGLLPWRARPIHLAIGLLPIALLSFQWEGTSLPQISRGFERDPLSDYISSHTQVGDTVYTDQIGRLLIETSRRPGSRFGTLFYFANYDDAPLDYGRAMLEDFRNRRPKYIILRLGSDGLPPMIRGPLFTARPQRRANLLIAWQELRKYINENYSLETTIDGNDLYRRD